MKFWLLVRHLQHVWRLQILKLQMLLQAQLMSHGQQIMENRNGNMSFNHKELEFLQPLELQ